MDRVILKHSILAIDNQLIPVDVQLWGKLKLTSLELENLSEAVTNLSNYLTASNVTPTLIIETINNQPVIVGVEATLDFTELQNTDVYKAYYSWAEKMQDDPDIVKFHWIEEFN